ncbi:hypothetical protein GA0074692_3845 [Micromonospora pallida]|uniref:Secreted protein n=1 Tax=Micromonospora pallida TaxID=145854 RepID=A0A1C6SY53_9ACTN|nr:hypothetical protein [Micromonospora pallida]SCL34491.1 hypothetical protein GA0074692_3845 [Micromonospora pallida]
MIRHTLSLVAAAVLGLSAVAAPALAAPAPAHAVAQSDLGVQVAPTGCTTWVEWVQEGSNSYFYGRGKAQCATGRYKVKLQCRNLQTGVGYVVYGGLAVNAPGTATATCYSGNVAEGVYPVEDPLPTVGVTGCVSWSEWVHEGTSHYYGRGTAQCDTGTYRVQIQCRNVQTGQRYVVYGPVVTAPSISTTTCYRGNVADAVSGVPA